MQPVTRYAPSPTGYLHLGHVVNAIYTWGLARAQQGRIRLRVEDHDRLRCRPEFETALLEDLDWLGFVADDGRDPVARQSGRPERYAQALDRLRAQGRVYACDCSRKMIGGERYGGRCRDRALPESPGRGLRVRLDPGTVRIDDLRLGPLAQTPADQCGDLLVRDRDGHWTYQFAVVVDDLEDGVTLVIRGEDLVDSTGRQVALGRLLGRADPPAFYHHPLVIKRDGRKLSKAGGDSGIRELRAAGLDAAAVIGRAAAAVGLVPEDTAVTAAEVAELFRRR